MDSDHSSSSELVVKSNTDSVIPAKSPRGRCQDVPKKLTLRGKEELVLVNNGKERSSCLSKRRKTLFKKGYTLHKRTGADVLLIVENDHERRFFGTGKLKNQFMEGTLRSKGPNEVKDNTLRGTNDDENDVILPLEKTPSPEGENTRPVQTVQSRVGRIVNCSSSRRSLDPLLENCDTRVLRVLTNRPVPVLVSSETNQNEK